MVNLELIKERRCYIGGLEWGRLLVEYKEGRSSVKKYINTLDNRQSRQENLLEISKDMYCEISSNLTQVRKNYLFELNSFLNSKDSSILTKKQHRIMTLRSKGLSMDQIGRMLDVSKTAVYKSIKLSEKKITKFFVSAGLTDSASILVSGGDYEQKS